MEKMERGLEPRLGKAHWGGKAIEIHLSVSSSCHAFPLFGLGETSASPIESRGADGFLERQITDRDRVELGRKERHVASGSQCYAVPRVRDSIP